MGLAMGISFKWSALYQSRWYEYLLRFGLGGLATVLAGAVAEMFGPEVGGLFLAFPAIFCASSTLIEKHERERKSERGLAGLRRGTDAAALDAAGACLGSFALAAFGLAISLLAASTGFGSLAWAALTWMVVSVVLWRVRREVRITK
jgi:hypothetical protein